MCGRFALAYPRANLIKWYHAVTIPEIEPRYNIAPSTDIVVIRDSVIGREGLMMHWGGDPSLGQGHQEGDSSGRGRVRRRLHPAQRSRLRDPARRREADLR